MAKINSPADTVFYVPQIHISEAADGMQLNKPKKQRTFSRQITAELIVISIYLEKFRQCDLSAVCLVCG